MQIRTKNGLSSEKVLSFPITLVSLLTYLLTYLVRANISYSAITSYYESRSPPLRPKIASTPESISGFTLRLRSMKVAVELVVDRMWKLGKRRNLMIESRRRRPATALNRQWCNAATATRRPSDNCYIIGAASLLPTQPAGRPRVIT